MNTHADKTQNKDHSSANNSGNKNISNIHFKDNRPEAKAQTKYHEMANNSSQVRQMGVYQKMANQGSQPSKITQPVASSSMVVQRAVREAKIIKDTQTRIRGERKSLIHGINGRDLKKGDKINVHDNKIFYSRMQTDDVQHNYRDNDVSTAWHKLTGSGNEYLRYDSFKFSNVKRFPSDDDQDTFYPFKGAEMIFITDNPSLCEEMVSLWIAKRGHLEGYENAMLGDIPAITKDMKSPFHDKARTIPKDVQATKDSDYIEHLHNKYPEVDQPLVGAKYQSVEHLLNCALSMPIGSMMHVSIRKMPIDSGGHAIGIARSKTQFYIFDPNSGIAKLSPARMVKSINRLLASADVARRIRAGGWDDLKLFYAVTIPNARFRGLRKY